MGAGVGRGWCRCDMWVVGWCRCDMWVVGGVGVICGCWGGERMV